MNLKKKLRRFFTLSPRANAGFTLVELIVVIAILAILAGIGVPAYSGYVTKANQQADMSLASEVAHALTLGYYSGTFETGYVVLSKDTDPQVSAEAVAAMTAAFGDYSALRLKAEHNIDYQESSFSGNEIELLGRVDTLTEAMETLITQNPSLIGTGFDSFLTANCVDKSDADKTSDLAVLYVAQNTAGLDRQAAIGAMTTLIGVENGVNGALDHLSSVFGGSAVSSAAALYAVAEAYARYEKDVLKNDKPLEELNKVSFDPKDVTDPKAAFNLVYNSFNSVVAQGTKDNEEMVGVESYFKDQAQKDAEAYFTVMDNVVAAKDEILANAGTDECFGKNGALADIYNSVAKGGVLISAGINEDGQLEIKNPLEN